MSPVGRPVAPSRPPHIRRNEHPLGQIAAAKDRLSSLLLSPSESPAGTSGLRRISRRELDVIQEAMSDQDWELLAFVQQVRLATGAQLRRVFWPGIASEHEAVARQARRRLQRLGEWRVLDRVMDRVAGGRRGGSQSYIWHVGPAGLRLLDRIGFTGKRLVTPSDRYVRHTLGITEVVVALLEAHRSGGLEVIEWQTEPLCWRPFLGVGGARLTLKPDLFVRLGAGRVYEDRSLVEFDLATESAATVEGKLRRHLAYRASGQELREHGVDPRVLWLVPDPRRAEVMWELLRKLDADERRLFAVAGHREAIAFLASEARV